MDKITWNDWDRELKGPAAYEIYNAAAKRHKKRYHWILVSQLITLLLISLLSSIPQPDILGSKPVQYSTLFLILFFMSLMILQYRANHMIKWQKSRFMAESCLSEAWFFSFGVRPYATALDQAKKDFLERIKHIKTELEMPQGLKLIFSTAPREAPSLPGDLLQNEFPEWVMTMRNKTNPEKIVFYKEKRINDQLKYYRRRAESNASKSETYFMAGLGLNILGAFLAILSIGGTLPSYTYIALFTTLSAAFVSWTQTKQYEEVSAKSYVAVGELQQIMNELDLIKPTDVFDIIERKVLEAEKLISREHKVKRT